MRLWRQMVMMALNGVRRRGGLKPDGAPEPLASLLAAVRDTDPRRVFLRRVAIVSTWRIAGRMPLQRGRAEGSEVFNETGRPRPLCPPRAAARLASMLDGSAGRAVRFLPEWLAAAAAAGLAVPPWYLPDLLSLGQRQPSLREAIRHLAGERGRWLARQNPDWHWLVEPRRPVAPAPRAKFRPPLAALTEPLLEWREDRRRPTIGITLPGEFDKAMRRLGLRRHQTSAAVALGLGDRQWWLYQMVSAVPPDHWASRWGRTPPSLVRAATHSVHGDLLLRAWSEAATRFADADWIEALLAERLSDPGDEAVALFAALPPERQEPWLITILRGATRLSVETPAFPFLAVARPPWGRRIAALLLPLIAREFSARGEQPIWDWQELLRLASASLDPRLLPQAERLLADTVHRASPLASALADFLDDLRFRAAMIGEIR